MDNINKDAIFHIFIGTSFTREDLPAYQVTKYSIESQSSIELNVFSIKPSDRLLIPTLCKEKGLKGKALYLDEGVLFKSDIKELYDLCKNTHLIWCVQDDTEHLVEFKDFMVFNLNMPRLYTVFTPNANKWKPYYSDNLHFISYKRRIIDEEVGNIYRDWLVQTDKPVKIPYKQIKCLYFKEEKPWLNPNCKFSHDWLNEYKLFIINVLLKDVNTLLGK